MVKKLYNDLVKISADLTIKKPTLTQSLEVVKPNSSGVKRYYIRDKNTYIFIKYQPVVQDRKVIESNFTSFIGIYFLKDISKLTC